MIKSGVLHSLKSILLNSSVAKNELTRLRQRRIPFSLFRRHQNKSQAKPLVITKNGRETDVRIKNIICINLLYYNTVAADFFCNKKTTIVCD